MVASGYVWSGCGGIWGCVELGWGCVYDCSVFME